MNLYSAVDVEGMWLELPDISTGGGGGRRGMVLGMGLGLPFGNGIGGGKKEEGTSYVIKPLAKHKDWKFMFGTEPDLFGYDLLNNGIVGYTAPRGDRLLNYKGYYSERGLITAQNVVSLGGTQDWSLPFAKFRDINNLVGARLNNGLIEITQKRNGNWSTPGTAPAVEGNWAVLIMNGYIEVFVNGVSQIRVGHQITGFGYYGIAGHQNTYNDKIICTDYDVNHENTVTYNSIPVTYNGEIITYK
jgi:hypothetical protein